VVEGARGEPIRTKGQTHSDTLGTCIVHIIPLPVVNIDISDTLASEGLQIKQCSLNNMKKPKSIWLQLSRNVFLVYCTLKQSQTWHA